MLLEVFCGVMEVWMDTGLEVFFCLCGRITGVEGLEAYLVFGVFLCLGGVLMSSVCKVWREGLLVFGSVQVGEGSSCLCL